MPVLNSLEAGIIVKFVDALGVLTLAVDIRNAHLQFSRTFQPEEVGLVFDVDDC